VPARPRPAGIVRVSVSVWESAVPRAKPGRMVGSSLAGVLAETPTAAETMSGRGPDQINHHEVYNAMQWIAMDCNGL
jgi:hypothetical protein